MNKYESGNQNAFPDPNINGGALINARSGHKTGAGISRLASLFRIETGRVFRSPATWAAAMVSTISPVTGLLFYRPLMSSGEDGYFTTMLGTYLVNPALAAGFFTALAFAALTLYEADRNRRSGAEALTGAVASPLSFALVRLSSLICAAAAAVLATALIWLPYTIYSTGAVFDGFTYAAAYALFMFGAPLTSILFTSAAYQFTRRFDVSLFAFIAFALLSLTVWNSDWQLCWLNPCVRAVSDAFSNVRVLKSVTYMRLGWLAALSGFWAVSYVCIRRYEQGVVKSFAVNARRPYRPLAAAALLALGCVSYVCQPFIDHSKKLLDFGFFDATEQDMGVNCSSMHVDARPDARAGSLYGTATYQISNPGGGERSVRFRTNPGYAFSSVKANGEDAPFIMNDDDEMNAKTAQIILPAAVDIELKIEYGGFPREWNIISASQGGTEISDKYMCLENTVLAPVPFGFAVSSDTVLAIDITLPGNMTPVPFGDKTASLARANADGTNLWNMEAGGLSNIVFAGDYIENRIDAGGLDVAFYYARSLQSTMEAANADETVKFVIDYCTNRYGPLSFYGKDGFKLILRRISGGGYASLGASTADELDFTMQNMNSPEKGGSPANVMIHEITHQWWGLGNMFYSESMSDAWTSEGLTVYTSYRIAKELYGEEYAKSNYIDDWRIQYDDYVKNYYVRNPQYIDILPEQYSAAIANSLSTVRHYSLMPLMILKAEGLVGGEAALDRVLAGLFARELNPEYPYLTYQEFLDACGLTEEDLRLG